MALSRQKKVRSRTVTRSRTATRRANGERMYSVTVRYAVGLDDMAWVAAQEFVLEDETPRAATARGRLWGRLFDRLRMYGPLGCSAWDEIESAQVEQAYGIARKYFPELEKER